MVSAMDDPGPPNSAHPASGMILRRNEHACNSCRRRKAGCDRGSPTCSNCVLRNEECVFEENLRKRKAPSKRSTYRAELEERLRRMEEICKRLGPVIQSRFEEDGHGNAGEGIASSLITNQYGECQYLGASSMLSLFSPKALGWIKEKTGEDTIEDNILPHHLNNGRWMSWKEDVFSDIFHRRVFTPLPPKEEAISMLESFFEAFNPLFPLFHQPTFIHLVERQYTGHSHDGSGWWASLNVALALAYILRKMSNSQHNDDEQKAWSFMKNALGVLSELTVRNTDLQSVQALLGMAHFMQTTSNPQLSLSLSSAAIRVSHSIGLHRENLLLNLSPVESEVRKRVFWVGYILDQDTSLRSGRPAAQDDSDMDMSLPDENPSDGVGDISLSSGTGKCNIFRFYCELALIQSKVHKMLYSVKASAYTSEETRDITAVLNCEMEKWKDRLPQEFRPGHVIKTTKNLLLWHVVMLHFLYHNCVMMANRSIDSLRSNVEPDTTDPRVSSSMVSRINAARSTISLLTQIPKENQIRIWLVLWFPVSALVTLYTKIIQHPRDPKNRSDLRLMEAVITFLAVDKQEDESKGVQGLINLCSDLFKKATLAMRQAPTPSQTKAIYKETIGTNLSTAQRCG